MAYEDDDYAAPAAEPETETPAEAPSQPDYVTDPDILAQLNAPEKSEKSEKPDYVTDPDLLARLNAPEEQKPEGQGSAFMREIAHDIGPSAVGAMAGAASAGAAGTLGAGPIGGFAAGMVGGFAGAYGGNVAQEKALEMLGHDDSIQRAANAKEHPWTVAAAGGLSNLVGFGRGAVSGAQRLFSAGLGGAVATGQEAYQRGGDLFTAEGAKEALPNILAQTAAGGAFPKPRAYVEAAGGWGARAAGGARPATATAPSAEPPPASPAQGGFDYPEGSPAAGGVKDAGGQQMGLPFHEAAQPYDARAPGQRPVMGHPELDLGTPAHEQGQLDLPVPEGRGGQGGLQVRDNPEVDHALNALGSVDTKPYVRRGMNTDVDIGNLVNGVEPSGIWHAVNVWEDRQPPILKYGPGQGDALVGRMQQLEDGFRQGNENIQDRMQYAQLRRQAGIDPATGQRNWERIGEHDGPLGSADVRKLMELSNKRQTVLGGDAASRTDFGMAQGRQAPHGTPGPIAAGGVAEAKAPPIKPLPGEPGHGPEDYGKQPPTPEGGGGMNVGPDPTLAAAINPPEVQAELPMGPPKTPPPGAEAPPTPPMPPDIPMPAAPKPPAMEPPLAAPKPVEAPKGVKETDTFLKDVESDIKKGHYDANLAPTTDHAEFKAAAEARGWKEGPYGKGKAYWSPDGKHVMFVDTTVAGNHLQVQWGEPGKGIKSPFEGKAEAPVETPKRDPTAYRKLDPNISAAEYSQRMSEMRDNKPRPLNKMWNDPSKAPPEQVAAHQAKIKAWNSEYNRVSKMQKLALARDNAAFEAKQAGAAKPVEAPKEPTAAELYAKGTPKKIQMTDDKGVARQLKVMDETTFADALKQHGTSKGLFAPLTDFVSKIVSKQIGKMPVYVIPHSEMTKYGEGATIGYYDSKHDHIVLNEGYLNDSKKMSHAVLHEGIHAVTVNAIHQNPATRRAIEVIMADVGSKLNNAELKTHRYGFFGGDKGVKVNAREFLAEAYSNTAFQKMLTEHNLDPKTVAAMNKELGTSNIKSAWDGIVETVRDFLGVPASKTNALEAVMRTTERAMNLDPAEKARFLKAMGTPNNDYKVPIRESGIERATGKPGVPKDPPMAKATKEDMETGFVPALQRWLGVRASSTPSGRAARNIIMKAEGDAEQLQQKAHAGFTNDMHNLMNRTPEHEQRMLVNYIQGGKEFPNFKPSPEQKKIVDTLRQIHQDFEDKMRSMPAFDQMHFWDNDKYLSGQYKDTQQAQNFYRTYAENNAASGSGSTKKKFYPTDEEARKAGLVPISTNPIERVLRYTDAMSNYISYQQQIQNGKASGYVKYFSPETVAAAGTPEPYVRGAPPEGWAPVRGIKDAGGRQAYAPREFAETMNNFHSSGIRGGMPREVVDAIRRTSNAFTAMELGVASYHAFTTVHERIASEWSTALSKAADGNMAGAAKSFAEGVASPITSVKEANRIYDVYLGKAKNATASELAIVDGMKAANFKPINAKHTLDYDMSKAGSLYTSYARGSLPREMEADFKNIMGGDWKAGLSFVPRMAGRMMQTIAQPLFEAYIPRMKTSAFTSNLKAWMEANPNHTREEMHEAAIKIGKSVDNRMGEMAHDNMMMHRALRDAASISLRSFSFTIGGVFREIGGGALSLGRGALQGENRLALSSKNYDPRTAYALAFPIAVASMSMLYQFIKTGKGPDEWRDLVWPETGGKQAGVGKGRQVPERALLPGYHKDIAAYIAHPTREAKNKLAGLWQAIGDQIAGTKMTEVGPVPIVPPKASLGEAALARGKAFGEKMTPIFARTATKVPQKETHITYPEQLLGLRAPGKWATDPVGQHIADDKRDERDWRSAERRLNADRASRGQAALPPYRIPKEPRP